MEDAAVLQGHHGPVNCLDAPGGPRLASGGADGSVRLWDLAAGRAARALMPPGGEEVLSVCLGCDGEAANWAYAAVGTHVYGFDLRAPGVLLREPARHFNANRDEIGQLALSRSGLHLASADDEGDVQVFDLQTGTACALAGGHDSLCSTVAFNPACDWELSSGGLDVQVVRWDFRRVLPVATWSFAPPAELASSQLCNPRHVHFVSYSPCGRALAVALGDGEVEIRATATGETLLAASAHRAAASQVHFAPALLPTASDASGPLPLLTAGDDMALRLWAVDGLPSASAREAHGLGPSKRRRGAAAGRRAPGGEDEDGDAEAMDGAAQPMLRPVCTAELGEKPNWVAAASSGGAAVVCTAGTGAAIRVLRVSPAAFQSAS